MVGGSLFAPLRMHGTRGGTRIFQRTYDAMEVSTFVLVVALHLLPVLALLGPLLPTPPLVHLGVGASLVVALGSRGGVSIHCRGERTSVRRVLFGIPTPSVTTLQGSLRITVTTVEKGYYTDVPALLVEDGAAQVLIQPSDGDVERLAQLLRSQMGAAEES
tara:strand:- start:885 stop:1367 length:483 start_codon:yes stop_codon:yes gene_type:complete